MNRTLGRTAQLAITKLLLISELMAAERAQKLTFQSATEPRLLSAFDFHSGI